METEDDNWVNPHLQAENSKGLAEKQRSSVIKSDRSGGKQSLDESVMGVGEGAKTLLKNKLKMNQNEPIKEVTEEDDQTQAEHESAEKQKKMKHLEAAKVEEAKVTFHSLPDEEGEDEESDSEYDEILEGEESKGNKSTQFRKKRLCNKVDRLFMMLYDDLNLLIEWENEEKKKSQEKRPDLFNYSGLVWVHRGILAERLCRKRLAERAFRNAIERGYSLYAWTSLLKIYAETYNPKACLVCMAEILDQAEEDGITKFVKVSQH